MQWAHKTQTSNYVQLYGQCAVVGYTSLSCWKQQMSRSILQGACKHKIFGFVCPLRIYPTVRFASSWSVDKINGLYIVRSMKNLEKLDHPVDITEFIHMSSNPIMRLYTELWSTNTAFYENVAKKLLSAYNFSTLT